MLLTAQHPSDLIWATLQRRLEKTIYPKTVDVLIAAKVGFTKDSLKGPKYKCSSPFSDFYCNKGKPYIFFFYFTAMCFSVFFYLMAVMWKNVFKLCEYYCKALCTLCRGRSISACWWLWSSAVPQHHDKHHFINKDWKGLKSPVDAAMAGRIYVAPLRSASRPDRRWGQQWGQQYQQDGWRRNQRRRNRSPSWESMATQGMTMGQGFAERGMEMGLRLAERRMEMEERLGRDWDRRRDWDLDRRWNQDWDQNRRWDRDWDRYNPNNRGNYDTRNDRFLQREMPIQSVYFFKAGNNIYHLDLL